MKTQNFFRISASVVAATLLLSACSKQEEPAAPAVAQKPAPAPAPAPVPEPPKVEAPAAPAEVKAAAEQAVDAAKTATPPAPPAASSQAQSLIERIKALIAEKKYSEALTAMSEITPANLTPDQQTLVEQLKTQAQNAMAKQTTDQGLKAVGGLLNQKK